MKRVLVGLSGGVDSAVSAALLLREGYEVTGAFIKGWYPDWASCTWREERRDAMRAAATLGIPFITVDAEAEYKQHVADYIIAEYAGGRTPNPDIMCNTFVKFGTFFEYAQRNGFDYVATGHYARIIDGALCEGVDSNKDQSYFLYTLPQEKLKSILFPIGEYTKTKVRALAKKCGLPQAEKKDSQGICFLGDISMKDFISHYIPQEKGLVKNIQGHTIGSHDGVALYTIGERHGFSIEDAYKTGTPYIVVKKDIAHNVLYVDIQNQNTSMIDSEAEMKNGLGSVGSNSVTIKDVILRVSDTHALIGKNIGARIRYRQKKQPCTVSHLEDTRAVITFTDAQQGIAEGQSIVLYVGDECIGGGVITMSYNNDNVGY